MAAPDPVSPANAQVADAAGLTYTDDAQPGIRRTGKASKTGKGFGYEDAEGKAVRDAATLERIRKLAIPPAYVDVWISHDPNGHIQATARDDRGRKQYRYHADWSAARTQTKFTRMAAFGKALPKIRSRVDQDLKRKGLPKEKVVAAVVRLLERTLIRVGNDEYAKTNKHFGLTTLRDKHVKFHGAKIDFSFEGKSGVKRSTGLKDLRLARIVRQCQEVPGQRLFQYYAEDGGHCAVGSGDVNAYLREITGEDFTAKDFRTWAGTAAAAKALAMQPAPSSEAEAKRLVTVCVKATAGLLGNTPSVCRSSYIHPEVFKAFQAQTLPKSFAKAEGDAYEKKVLKFLKALGNAEAASPKEKAKALKKAKRQAKTLA